MAADAPVFVVDDGDAYGAGGAAAPVVTCALCNILFGLPGMDGAFDGREWLQKHGITIAKHNLATHAMDGTRTVRTMLVKRGVNTLPIEDGGPENRKFPGLIKTEWPARNCKLCAVFKMPRSPAAAAGGPVAAAKGHQMAEHDTMPIDGSTYATLWVYGATLHDSLTKNLSDLEFDYARMSTWIEGNFKTDIRTLYVKKRLGSAADAADTRESWDKHLVLTLKFFLIKGLAVGIPPGGVPVPPAAHDDTILAGRIYEHMRVLYEFDIIKKAEALADAAVPVLAGVGGGGGGVGIGGGGGGGVGGLPLPLPPLPPLHPDSAECIMDFITGNVAILDPLYAAIKYAHPRRDLIGLSDAVGYFARWAGHPASATRKLNVEGRFSYPEEYMALTGDVIRASYPKAITGPGNFSLLQFLNGVLALPIGDEYMARHMLFNIVLRNVTRAAFPEESSPAAAAFKAAIAPVLIRQIDLKNFNPDVPQAISFMSAIGINSWSKRIGPPTDRMPAVNELFASAAKEAIPEMDSLAVQHMALFGTDNIITRISRVVTAPGKPGAETTFKFILVGPSGPVTISIANVAEKVRASTALAIMQQLPTEASLRKLYKACFGPLAVAPVFIPSSAVIRKVQLVGSAVAPDIPPVVAMLNSKVTSLDALPVLGAYLMVAKVKSGEAARHGGGGSGVPTMPKGGSGPGSGGGGVPKGATGPKPKPTAPPPKGPIHMAAETHDVVLRGGGGVGGPKKPKAAARVCDRCKFSGHEAKDCRTSVSKLPCSKCSKRGHADKACPPAS